MIRRTIVAAGLAGALGCLPPSVAPRQGRVSRAASQSSPSRAVAAPRTRAERSAYTETSRHADVVAFLDSLRASGVPYAFGSLGTSTEGRTIPYVIAARPRVSTPDEARRLGRPVVYVNGGIHAGEVEGKEVVLALLRDLAADPRPNVLDSLVLVVVPMYNPDGADRVGPQDVNRNEQRGPERVGIRPNGQGLDLNRDYVKAEAPETRGALALFREWDPAVYVDLHTTDGSYHGYALTYAASLSPASPLGAYTRGLLAELRGRLRAARPALQTFDYGNFDTIEGERDVTDSAKSGWYTFDPRPRFGTNYYGLRGRVSVLVEAFSHDPFARRVESTDRFLRALLSLVAERAKEIRDRTRAADAGRPDSVPLGSALTAPRREAVLVERLERTGDSSVAEPGVPTGVRRTGQVTEQVMPVYDHFDGTRWASRSVGYLISAADTAVLARLALHGVRVVPVAAGQTFAGVRTFRVDSVRRASEPFQKHRTVRVRGAWGEPYALTAGAAMAYVPTDQPLGTLAVYLLEPESEDGFTTWNLFDAALDAGRYPVLRIAVPPAP